jgi:hypothetical protein
MPYPDAYGRHPWIHNSRYDLLNWRLYRREPPRFWDEEYYIDNPGLPPSMMEELENETSRGYRFAPWTRNSTN